MKRRPLLGLALLVWLCGTARLASAVEIQLRPRQAPGDSYFLSLTVTTDTQALSRGAQGRSADEIVKLSYQAHVRVLEVDERGHARLERHDGVQLGFERPDRSGSLFEPGAVLEVRRGASGRVRIYTDGRRAGRELERVVTEVLAGQLEHSREAALLDPGRPVEIGERWALDPALTRRFLRERGVRVLRFATPPSAWLERQVADDGAVALALRYSIPIAWYEPNRLPRNARSAESEASLEGRVMLASEGPATPVGRASVLRQSLHGVTSTGSGADEAVAWRVHRSQRTDQSVVRVTAGAPAQVVSDSRTR